MPDEPEILAEKEVSQEKKEKLDISEENIHRAQLLTDKFGEMVNLSPTRQQDRWSSMSDTARNIAGEAPIEDVIDNVGRFAVLVSIAREIKVEDIPSIYFAEIGMVPNLEASLPLDPSKQNVPTWVVDELYYRGWLSGGPTRGSHRSRAHSKFDEALNGFKKGLQIFLRDRLEGYTIWKHHSYISEPTSRQPEPGSLTVTNSPRRQGPEPPVEPPLGSVAQGGVGFHVHLICQNHHLVALASTAYALHWDHRGSHTTPGKFILPPGHWIFGAEGGSTGFRYDPKPVHIPPKFDPPTTCF